MHICWLSFPLCQPPQACEQSLKLGKSLGGWGDGSSHTWRFQPLPPSSGCAFCPASLAADSRKWTLRREFRPLCSWVPCPVRLTNKCHLCPILLLGRSCVIAVWEMLPTGIWSRCLLGRRRLCLDPACHESCWLTFRWWFWLELPIVGSDTPWWEDKTLVSKSRWLLRLIVRHVVRLENVWQCFRHLCSSSTSTKFNVVYWIYYWCTRTVRTARTIIQYSYTTYLLHTTCWRTTSHVYVPHTTDVRALFVRLVQ